MTHRKMTPGTKTTYPQPDNRREQSPAEAVAEFEPLTNMEAVERTGTPGLFRLLADGCELRTEILAELAERGFSAQPVTPEGLQEIRDGKIEDYGLDA
jgi:hypothetical protein